VTQNVTEMSMSTEPALDPGRWLGLACVLTGLFMILLDLSIVNVAIPAIRINLSANNADIQFVVAGYGLAYAVMLIAGGRLGDIYGRKRLFMLGMAGFIIASALCGLSQSAVMLDISRAIQGFMAALMYPQVYSVIQVSFPARERGQVFAIVGAIIGIATIMGPLVGGLIIRSDLTGTAWRWIFLVNVPIGIVALFAASRVITESHAADASRLDLVGMGLATLGLGLLVYPLVQGQNSGWPLWTFVCMALSPVVLALFVLYERSLSSTKFPLVQLSLFSIPSFRVGVLISAAFLAGIPSFFFVFVLMLQSGLGYSALHAGLTTVPWTAGVAFASGVSTKIAPRLGKWTIVIGSLLLVFGTLGIILTLHVAGVGLTSLDLAPAFLIAGLGLGTVIAPLLNIILAGVPPCCAGSSSGVLTTFQQLGGAIGIAIVGVVFFSVLSGFAVHSASTAAPTLRNQIDEHQVSAVVGDQTVAKFRQCFDEQMSSNDPSSAPHGCPAANDPNLSVVGLALRRAGQLAAANDFVHAVEVVLFLPAGFWLLTGLLAIVLPRVRLDGAHSSG